MFWGIGNLIAAIFALACGVQFLVKAGVKKVSISFGLGMASLALFFGSAGLLILIPGHVQGFEKLVYRIMNFLFPLVACILPYLFLIISRHYGRATDIEDNHRLSTFSKLSGQVTLVILALVVLGLVFRTGYTEYGYTLVFHGFVGRAAGAILGVLFIMALLNFENTRRAAQGIVKRQILILMIINALLLAGLVRIFFLSKVTANFYSYAAPMVMLCFGWLYFLLLHKDTYSSNIVVDRQAFLSSAIILFLGVFLVFAGVVAIIVEKLGGRTDVFLSILGAFLVIALFLLVLLSDSLRNRFSNAFQSRIYAGRFDYKAEWHDLSEDFASCDQVSDLIKAINERLGRLFNSSETAIYLAEDNKFTAAHPTDREMPSFDSHDSIVEWIFLKGEPTPIDGIEEIKSSGMAGFVTSFDVIIPIIAQKRLVGMILLGKKGEDSEYNTEDFALLHAMSHQAAVTILHLRSRDKLLESEKLASFHRTASFVVHDLKNAVSMLSLMLQNAPAKMADPEFQKESINTISQAVARMQKIIEKLRAVPVGEQLRIYQLDPKKILDNALQKSGIVNITNIKLIIDPETFAQVKTDPSVLETVFINLLINAVEAMPEGGEIRISQAQAENKTEITVSDTGAGMSRDFIKNKLFKPFETTKTNGLGVGLYQCREMFIRAGGEIMVESEPGKGSSFRLVFR